MNFKIPPFEGRDFFLLFFLFLGRLNVIKGPDLLLEAFARIASQFPELHLVFAGPDSGLRSSLQETTAKAGLKQRVHFIGYLGGEAKVSVLHDATCLVIPSRNEAMSIVVLEAGVCETPVLFTDRCGLEEFARADAGVMVAASAEAICYGLMGMLENPENMHESAKRLRTMINEGFLWTVQAERYYKLYQRVLS